MSGSSLMSLGVKAMTANYAAMQTTSNNIANANVAGYSRQTAQLATSPGQYSGAGYFGNGVDVTTVTRAYNAFLTSSAAAAQSQASKSSAALTQLQAMQSVFQIGGGTTSNPTGQPQGLGDAVNQLFSSISDLANNPGDLSARTVVLSQASNLAAQFNAAGNALDQIQSDISSQLKTSVADVNTLAQSVASLNEKIAAAQAQGQPPNDLLDQRDQLISQISSEVQVTRLDNADGTTSLFVGGGQTLVLGVNAIQLAAMQDPSDPSRSALGVMDGNTPREIDVNALGGGTIAGLLGFQNNDLVAGRDLVGQLATAVGGAMNQAQKAGLNLQPPLGTNAGAAMFSLGQPQALSNSANTRDPVTGALLGSVSLAITNPAAVQASDYALAQNSAGAWQLTRLSDGKITTPVASGDVVDGMQITINNGQPGDRYLLQPVARVANNMSALLSNPLDVAAASPLVASTALANTGTAAVASLHVDSANLPTPGATTQISFTDNSGDYSWQLTDSGGIVLSSGVGSWQAGQPVPATSTTINGFTLQLSGVPKSGDVITVAPTPSSAVTTNNGNATAMLGLQNAGVVAGATPSDAWAQAIADVGVRVQSGQSASDIDSAAAGQAGQAAASVSGVNMDEEAANLIRFQQSYQAAAKVLQVAQTIFDSLLQAAG